MPGPLFLVTDYLTSFWSSKLPTISKQSDSFQLNTTQSAIDAALNQIISNNLSGCTLRKATLKETKEGKLSFHSKSTGTYIFSDEKTMDEWFADQQMVDIWQIKDQRTDKFEVFYKLQRNGNRGYDNFKTENQLFDQLRKDYGVFWKLVDPEQDQTSYIRFKTGIFGNYYEEVDPANLIYVANNLELKTCSHPHTTTSPTLSRTSWGKGIAACLLGGLLLSAGRSWIQNSDEDSLSNALAMMKGTLGSTAFKAALVFQMSAVAAMSRNGGETLPSVLFTGIMLLPELVMGQSCPLLAGSYDTQQAFDVAVSGNYAYMADDWGGGLQIIDVSNVTNPLFAGAYNTPNTAYGVAVSGNHAYVADDSSLQIIDVSNVATPTLAGVYDLSPAESAYKVVISGNYAYVVGDSSLQIIDVSNVANPTLAGSYPSSGGIIADVAILGNYAYLVEWSSFQIIDVSNVANPTLVSFYIPSGLGDAHGIAISGNYAYIARGTSSLDIINISNVANLTLVGSSSTSNAYDVVISGNYAYVADFASGLQIIDVSDVTNPIRVGTYDTPDTSYGVAVSDNYVYVADGYTGLLIIDLACPTSSTTTSSSSSSTSSRNPTTTMFSSTTFPTSDSSTSSMTTSTNHIETDSRLTTETTPIISEGSALRGIVLRCS